MKKKTKKPIDIYFLVFKTGKIMSPKNNNNNHSKNNKNDKDEKTKN